MRPPWRRSGRPRRSILAFRGDRPRIAESAWVAPDASIVGNVQIAERVGIFYGARLRAEGALIEVGEQTNIQDNCVVHAGLRYAVHVGRRVTIGHAAIVHGCTVQDGALVGMGAIVLNDSLIGAGSLVAAGSVVLEGVRIPAGVLVAGSPARVIRDLTTQERIELDSGVDHYLGLLPDHRAAGRRAPRSSLSS